MNPTIARICCIHWIVIEIYLITIGWTTKKREMIIIKILKRRTNGNNNNIINRIFFNVENH